MVAEQLFCLRVDQNDAPGIIYDDHRIRRGIEQAPEKFFGTLALGNVSHHRADQQPVRTLHGAEANFDGELGSVFAQSVELQPGTHRPELRATHEACSVPAMFATESFWNQRLDGLSN